MKNSTENNYKIQIRIMYFLILLLSLSVLVLSFVLIYSPHCSNIRLDSPYMEERERTKQEAETNIISNTAFHDVNKREISSEFEKESGENYLSKSKTSEEDNSIMLNGNCYVKKTGLCHYCLTEEDFCTKNSFELKDCILDNITKNQSFLFKITKHLSIILLHVVDNSKGNIIIWLKHIDYPLIKKYRMNKNGEFKILEEITLPNITGNKGIIYKESYYSLLPKENKIDKYNFETDKSIIGEELDYTPEFPYININSDENSIWVIGVNYDYDVAVYQMNPDNLQVLSMQIMMSKNIIFEECSFVAFGKFYIVEHDMNSKVFLLIESNRKHILKILEYTGEKREYFIEGCYYNFKEQSLYVLYAVNYPYKCYIYRYKLHFNCTKYQSDKL